MKKRIRADEAFEQALQGELPEAPPQLAGMAKLAEALQRQAPAAGPRPDDRYRARLRSELLAAAAYQASQEEELFAAMLEGAEVQAPAEMRQLVKVASSLEPASLPTPDPVFRFGLRNRLVGAATYRNPVARAAVAVANWNDRMRRKGRAIAALGMALTMMLGASASLAASRDSLPGDWLYPLKRFQESAQLVGTSGAMRGERHLGFARERIREVDRLLDRGVVDPRVYIDTLNAMDEATIEGRDLIFADYSRTRNAAGLHTLEAFAREQAADLGILVDRLPPAARPIALDSLTLVESIAKHTLASLALSCSVCPEGFSSAVDARGMPTDLGHACPCPEGDTTFGPAPPPSDEAPTGGEQNSSTPGGSNEPGDGDGSEEPRDPTVDLPSLPGDLDEDAEDLIDDLLDLITEPLESPTPLPSLPGLPGL